MMDQRRNLEESLAARAVEQLCKSPKLLEEFVLMVQAKRSTVWGRLAGVVNFFCSLICLLVIAFILAVFCALFCFLFETGGLALHSLISLIVACVWAFGLRGQMKQSELLTRLSHLPVPDRVLATDTWWEWMWPKLVALYLHGCFYAMLAYLQPSRVNWLAIPALIVGQWLIGLATATIFVTWVGWRWMILFLALSASAVIGFCCLDPANRHTANTILLLCLPTGWLNGVWSRAIVSGNLNALALVVPAAMWLMLGRFSFTALTRSYRIDEFVFRLGSPAEVTARPAASFAYNLAAEPSLKFLYVYTLSSFGLRRKKQEKAASDPVIDVRSRQFLHAPSRSNWCWIERLADCWLTPRERTVVDALGGGDHQWSACWYSQFLFIPLMLYVQAVVPGSPFAIGFAFVSAALLALVDAWPALRTRVYGNLRIPSLAVLPWTFDEISLAIFKVICLRTVAALVHPLLPCVLLTLRLPWWPWGELLLAITFAIFIIGLGIWRINCLLSAAASLPDGREANVADISIWFTLSAGGAVGLICIARSMHHASTGEIGNLALGVAILVVTALAGWAHLRHLYTSGSVDLLRQHPVWWEGMLESDGTAASSAVDEADTASQNKLFGWFSRDLSSPQVESK